MLTFNQGPEVEANLVPVHIQYTGEAKTKEYFTNTKDKIDGNDIAYFRGLKLVGRPVNVNGYLLDSVDDNYTSIASFSSFTLFGHDTLESENQWELINEWYDISDVLMDD